MAPPATQADALTAVELADLVLAAAVRKRAAAVFVEPSGAVHSITLDRGTSELAFATVPSRMGQALVLRLAILAGLDVARPDQQLGRIAATSAGTDAEFLLVVRASPSGLEAELRRIVDRERGQAPRDDGASIGERLGVYRLYAELGRGGMGVVYRGEHIALGRPVAIKLLHSEITLDPRVAARFVREARAASRANHPNIVEVIDFGTTTERRPFLVMELIDGVTLERLIERGPLAPLRAARIAQQIAAALEVVHLRDIVHRDLKPANIFVCAKDHVKVGDFGAAKLTDAAFKHMSITQKGFVLGTPLYMSPEHIRGLETDRRTDVYALGCVLYEMLTGHVPFDGATAVEVMVKHVSAPVPPVTSPYGPVPEVLEWTVLRALAKRLEDRYPTAGDMNTDLDCAVAALEQSERRKERA